MIFSFGISDVTNNLFMQGNQFIFDGKYGDAVQSYESILELGYENSDIYFKLVFDPILFLFPTEYTLSIFLKIREKKIINNAISIIRRICKFLSLNVINPSFIKVRKVKIPRNMQRNEDMIIQ